MKKQMILLLCAALLAGMLTGCGGEYGQTGLSEGVSGSAVSGGAVSGQAVSDGAVDDEHGIQTKKGKKYQNCNDTNLYYVKVTGDENKETLVERKLTDGTEREFPIEDGYGGILYVDNDWIYYCKEVEKKGEGEEDEYQDSFWRAPMEKSGDGCHVNMDKEELVISAAGETDTFVFCNGRWIVYAPLNERGFCQYDIENRKFISQNKQKMKEYATLPVVSAKGAVVSFPDDDYWLDGSSGKLIPIPEFTGMSLNVVDSGILFIDSIVYNDEDEVKIINVDVKLWHFPDDSYPEGRLESIISDEEVRRLLKKEVDVRGDVRYETVSAFIRDNTLYQQISIHQTEKNVTTCDIVILSRELGGQGELRVEEKLTGLLRNPKEKQKVFKKIWGRAGAPSDARFLSRGVCVDMTEEYCFFVLSEPGEDWRVACYEFEGDTLKILDENDDEWYLLFMDSNTHPGEVLGGFSDYMPDNNGEEVE